MGYIKIGNRKIGVGYPAYIVAEIGINHNGDMKLAEKTIEEAKYSGADAVKFQNYNTEDFLIDKKIKYKYLSQGKIIEETQYDMFKRCEMSDEQVINLKRFCDKMNIDFHSTPTSFHGIDLLKKIGVKVLKNGSDFLTNLDLIRSMGLTKLPTVISTGMSTKQEIDDAVQAFKLTENKDLILLHCTSSYPTPVEDINLKMIETLSSSYNVAVGFSDHSEGVIASATSIAYGACWIEKHFTIDNNLPGPDHEFSCNPEKFKQLVNAVRYTEKAIGNGSTEVTSGEEKSRIDFRLSCAAKKALEPGQVVADTDICFVRPGSGLPPKNKKLLIGKKVKNKLYPGDILKVEDFY